MPCDRSVVIINPRHAFFFIYFLPLIVILTSIQTIDNQYATAIDKYYHLVFINQHKSVQRQLPPGTAATKMHQTDDARISRRRFKAATVDNSWTRL
jgi:hypothetical protein